MAGFRAMTSQIAEDYRAHGRDWTKPGFRALASHRFGNWRMEVHSAFLRFPLTIIYRFAFRYCRNVYGIELPYTASIGREVVFEHQGGIVIHGNTTIGDKTIVRQNCTLGIKDLKFVDQAPIIGRNVSIGAGAVILGKVIVGDGAAIGANAVVLEDVPAGWIAVGVPAVAKPNNKNA